MDALKKLAKPNVVVPRGDYCDLRDLALDARRRAAVEANDRDALMAVVAECERLHLYEDDLPYECV